MAKIVKSKKLDVTIDDVNEVYTGPVGVLWEFLMGEHVHVGGEKETEALAKKAGIGKGSKVLDVCSALGGPARYIAKNFGCNVVGLDATRKMFDEAVKRTEKAGLSSLISYKLGNALDMPFKAGTFDIVLGQDAWCYITNKERLISEAHRVLKPGGTIAFTDWLQVGNATDKEWEALNGFMAFPYMETLDGYASILKSVGFKVIEMEDQSADFAKHCHIYQDKLRKDLKEGIVKQYSLDLFKAADDGLAMWVKAADEGKVGRGRIIGKKVK